MTPNRYFDSKGNAFATTVLDNRAGIKLARGNYVLAKDDEDTGKLPAEVFTAIETEAREGERLIAAKDFRGASSQFVAALQRLPEPHSQWHAAGWLLVAIGECAIQAQYFAGARRAFTDAMWCAGTIGNPWVHLRFGETLYELGNQEKAADELSRAYMGGGREIFRDQDPKYFALLERVLKPPPRSQRLP